MANDGNENESIKTAASSERGSVEGGDRPLASLCTCFLGGEE
jgi:hypothetical protein